VNDIGSTRRNQAAELSDSSNVITFGEGLDLETIRNDVPLDSLLSSVEANHHGSNSGIDQKRQHFGGGSFCPAGSKPIDDEHEFHGY
jgi:hypothetical protein